MFFELRSADFLYNLFVKKHYIMNNPIPHHIKQATQNNSKQNIKARPAILPLQQHLSNLIAKSRESRKCPAKAHPQTHIPN